jgi:flagellar M-ring protein FliF
VAVVVNYKKQMDKDGKVTMVPLTDVEKTQVTNLVKEAMGFNQERASCTWAGPSARSGP